MAIWKNPFQNFKGSFNFVFGSFGPKVTGFVFFDFAGNENSGKIFLDRYFYVDVVFIVLHKDVIFWMKFFDKVGFEHDRLQIGSNGDVFNIGNLFH